MQSNPAAMEAFVIGLLKTKLPFFYYYHNYEHTLYVLDKAIEIGQQESCTPSEIELLRAAALWHDAGCINKYAGHEKESCLLAQQYMPAYGYSADDIAKVCGMIRATKIPQSPKNKLEEIIADADLEYLGTDSAASTANKLFKELQHLNPSLTKAEWDRMQISFLQKHHYFTWYCKENREPVKLKYLNKLINDAE
jgi:uncharacterized protein